MIQAIRPGKPAARRLRTTARPAERSRRAARLALGEASVIELDRQAGELLDVFVNGTLIGRGEVVTVGDRFGVRMTELVNPDKRG